ncbi:hypothetical protein IKZ40_02185 [bacterium]|nr:hypothetical protein [bacterium]
MEKLHGLTASQSDVEDIAEKLERLALSWEKDNALREFSYTPTEASFFDSLNTTKQLSEALEELTRKES